MRGAMLDTLPRDIQAAELGEWVLEGITPILFDFGDDDIRINAPLPALRQGALLF